jgi:hypothetical protein
MNAASVVLTRAGTSFVLVSVVVVVERERHRSQRQAAWRSGKTHEPPPAPTATVRIAAERCGKAKVWPPTVVTGVRQRNGPSPVCAAVPRHPPPTRYSTGWATCYQRRRCPLRARTSRSANTPPPRLHLRCPPRYRAPPVSPYVHHCFPRPDCSSLPILPFSFLPSRSLEYVKTQTNFSFLEGLYFGMEIISHMR